MCVRDLHFINQTLIYATWDARVVTRVRVTVHLVSVHDAGLTSGKVSRGFDVYNTVYFLDPKQIWILIIRRHFINSSCVNIKYLFQANEKLTSVQSKLSVDNKSCQSFVKLRIFCFSIAASADA